MGIEPPKEPPLPLTHEELLVVNFNSTTHPISPTENVDDFPAQPEDRTYVDADAEVTEPNEHSLDHNVSHYACHRLQFTPDLDLFANSENAQVTRFLSAYPMTRSCGVNAFNYDWSEDAGYAYHPWSLMPRVLRKLCSEGARVMLVFHEWPNAPWYPVVRELELRSFLVTSPCYL